MEQLFKALPLELQQSQIFKEIVALILNDFKKYGAHVVYKIGINKSLEKDIRNIGINYEIISDDLLNFAYYYNTTVVTLNIYNENEDYSVCYKASTRTSSTKIIFIKTLEKQALYLLEGTKENGIYNSFDIKVNFYDSKDNELPEDTEYFKNILFADEFGISTSEAHKYRQNFKEYALFLSRKKTEHKMANKNTDLKEIDLLHFSSPFQLTNFKEFLNIEYQKTSMVVLKNLIGIEYSNINYECLNRIDIILPNLINAIGIDGQVIISQNIIDNLTPVLTGEEADSFNLKGLIIKRTNNEFIMYWTEITRDTINIVQKRLQDNEIQAIYIANPQNKYVEGLSEFFYQNKRNR